MLHPPLHRPDPLSRSARPGAMPALSRAWTGAVALLARLALALALGLGLAAPAALRAEIAPEFTEFDVLRNDEGVQLNFSLKFELPRGVEEALQKGVPLYFVADAEVFRDRWYWTDKRVSRASRVWRLAFQPLTRKYRVTFGGLNQNFDSMGEALAAVRRVAGWKVAEPGDIEPGARHYVELRYRLDTTLLPRPMQIGIGGQPEWTLVVEKFQRFN